MGSRLCCCFHHTVRISWVYTPSSSALCPCAPSRAAPSPTPPHPHPTRRFPPSLPRSYSGVQYNQDAVRILLGDTLLMDKGQPLPFDEKAASAYLKGRADVHGTVNIQARLSCSALFFFWPQRGCCSAGAA